MCRRTEAVCTGRVEGAVTATVNKEVGVVDYGVGNIRSLCNALEAIGSTPVLLRKQTEIENSNCVVLPGVGAFEPAMKNLRESGLIDPLKQYAASGRLLIGICLGMQLLCRHSLEDGEHEGLGLIDADVVPFSKALNVKVPHMGWNTLRFVRPDALPVNAVEVDVYFVHSFYVQPDTTEIDVATAHHGREFTAMFRNENVLGMQFHPEKSQDAGLNLLRAALSLADESIGDGCATIKC